MTKERKRAMKWLDKVIECQEFLDTKMDDEVMYCGCFTKTIHLYKGAKKLACALGVQYEVEYLNTSNEISHKISFPYKDYTVFQLVRRY